MDALSGERGQALIVAALFLAVAAVAISGLRLAQDQILAAEREHRAGEAAAEAASAVIADAYVTGMLQAPGTRESARAAASDLSLLNGGSVVSDVLIACERGSVDVALVLGSRRYRAGFAAPECSPR